MKKIITALTVTALAIGSVFAQASVEYTQKAFIVSPKGNKLEMAGYDGNDGNIKFQVKNSQAGAWLTIKGQIGTAEKYDGSGQPDYDEATATYTYTDKDGKTKTSSHGPTFSEYAGWVKFGDGLFKLQSGTFDARAANRFTSLAGKWQGSVYERYKLGVAGGAVAKDVDNYGCINGDKVLTSFIEYAGEAITVRAAINKNDFATLDMKSGFSFNAVTTIGEGTKLVADFKLPKKDQLAFALFAENTTLKENLDFLVGFTFGQTKTSGTTAVANSKATNTAKKTEGKNFEAAIDIRAKYALSDNLGLTTMNNLTYLGTATTPQFNLWDMVSLDTRLSDKITAMFTVEWEYKDLDAHGKGELDFVPSVTYSPVKGVDLTAGLIIYTYGWSKPDTTMFSIPLLLHVSL